MLSELHKYALDNGLAARPGFKVKKIAAYFSLSLEGEFLGIEPGAERACPDLGSTANSATKCNILVEKAGIVLDLPDTKSDGKRQFAAEKHLFFLDALEQAAVVAPRFGVCLDALKDEQKTEQMREALVANKIKPSSPVGFKVDGRAIEADEDYYAWWEGFRSAFQGGGGGAQAMCLITGGLTRPMQTVPKIRGLFPVGGHSAGDALICFDKDAFCSYGLEQSANAAVSEEAMTTVNAALNHLIGRAPILAGARWVHWYDQSIPEEANVLAAVLGSAVQAAPEEDEEESEDKSAREKPERAQVLACLKAADELIQSAKDGTMPQRLRARYHILCLSGANGRVMIRSYTQGSYEELYESIRQWYDHLRIVMPRGGGSTLPPELFAMNVRLLGTARITDGRKLRERIDDELSSLEVQLINAIIHKAPLPDTVASRALQYIQSLQHAERAGSSGGGYAETVAYQLLKAWLIRRQQQKGGPVYMSENLTPENPSVAYQAGRMMAIFAKIQEAASGGTVNAGVVERYYTAASSTPGLVIGKLSDLSQHHLAKMDGGLAHYYTRKLSEVTTQIGARKIPATLSLEQKTEFALGYYQQLADLHTKKNTEGDQNNGDQQSI